jgi:hypothetical protein
MLGFWTWFDGGDGQGGAHAHTPCPELEMFTMSPFSFLSRNAQSSSSGQGGAILASSVSHGMDGDRILYVLFPSGARTLHHRP